jgi:hypothetical protein
VLAVRRALSVSGMAQPMRNIYRPGLSGRGIEDVLTETRIARQVVRDAVKRAIDQGYVTTTPGPKRSHLHYTTPASAPVRAGTPTKVCASAPAEGTYSHTHSTQSSAPPGALTCPRCNYPATRLVPPDGPCLRCAYPGGSAPDDDTEESPRPPRPRPAAETSTSPSRSP